MTHINIEHLIETLLDESKMFATHPHVKHAVSAHRRPRTLLHTYSALADTDAWRTSRANAKTVGQRQFVVIQDQFRFGLMAVITKFKNGRISKTRLTSDAKEIFDTAYTAAYRLGLKSSGLPSAKTSINSIPVDANDKEWIKSSLAHERRYWNSFVTDVVNDEISSRRFSVTDRINMYVDTLEHVFHTGRVIGQPSHAIIYWQMSPEVENCPGCQYLRDNSPYTRETLPTTPKAGACPCLYNCACSLRVVVPNNMEQWQRIKAAGNRKTMVSKLQSIKSGRTKYGT